MQKGNILIFLLVGIIVLAAIGGAFYLGRSTTPKPSPTPASTSQVNPSPSVSPAPADTGDNPVPNGTGETANWKTYADPQLGITFKYPSTGIIQTSSSPPQVTLNNDRNPPYFLFMIGVVANSQGLTSKQVLENGILALRNNKNIPGDGAKTLADNRQSTIKAYQSGLISGFYMNWGYERDLNGGAIEIVSINDDKIYTFSMHDGNGVTEKFQKKLTDQILSTFKFTN